MANERRAVAQGVFIAFIEWCQQRNLQLQGWDGTAVFLDSTDDDGIHLYYDPERNEVGDANEGANE